ncbi:MAG: DNA gyrase subunit A [Acidimicrobiales bacterium]
MASRRRPGADTPDLFTPVAEAPEPVEAAGFIGATFLAYARAVNGARQVCDVRDGLKPVHRRILWDLDRNRVTPDRAHVKCARITGDTVAKFHPHGTQSVYDALVRLAQPFNTLVPLVDFHGNVGSPDFPPAAERYTECRLARAAVELLAEVDAGTVDLQPNYDGLEIEPVVLPARFPNLLVNGTVGIGVGMATVIPPHDPRAVCAAALHLIANRNATVDELAAIVQGPDFPSGGTIVNASALADVYRSGRGRVILRGTWIVEDAKRGAKRIVITSMPYSQGATASASELCARVAKLATDGKLAGVRDVINESSEEDTRVVIELRAEASVEQVIAVLLKETRLQTTVGVAMVALNAAGVPQAYNLRTVLEAWVVHRVEVIERRSRRRLEKIAERLHLLEGLLAVLVDIDRAIAIIRAADDVAAARAGLIQVFSLSVLQADFVLDLTLRRLTRLARVEVEKEADELRRERKRLEALVESPTKLRRQVGVELEETAGLFEGYERRTVLSDAELVVPAAVALPDDPIEVVVTDRGYLQAFRTSAKVRAPKEGAVLRRLDTSTAAQIVALTSTGQLHRIVGAVVPIERPTAQQNLIALDGDEAVLWWTTAPALATDLLLVTSGGQIKRIAGDDVAGGDRKGGISIVKLDEGERVVAAIGFPAGPLLLATAQGQAIRFVPDDVRPMGRSAAGVRGLKLAAGDAVVGAMAAPEGSEVVVWHTTGLAKRVPVEEVPVQGRAGKGVRLSPVDKRRGTVSAVFPGSATLLVGMADGSVVELPAVRVTTGGRETSASKIRALDATPAWVSLR